MAANLTELRAIIDAGHPTTGPYDADDSICNDELHALNLDGPPDTTAFREYLAYERFRTGTLYGRLQMVANVQVAKNGTGWEIPDQPLGPSPGGCSLHHDSPFARDSASSRLTPPSYSMIAARSSTS